MGRYCSYLLPRQDGIKSQIKVNGRFLPSRCVTLYKETNGNFAKPSNRIPMPALYAQSNAHDFWKAEQIFDRSDVVRLGNNGLLGWSAAIKSLVRAGER